MYVSVEVFATTTFFALTIGVTGFEWVACV